MIGANALIAETGSVLLITNEGNGDLVSTLPRLLIVIAGWEKIVPTFDDAAAQVRLLARSGTGQEITTYTTFITGPEPGLRAAPGAARQRPHGDVAGPRRA